MSDQYVLRTRSGKLLYSILTGRPMRLGRNLAEETRADLNFEDRHNAPHRIEPADQTGEKPCG